MTLGKAETTILNEIHGVIPQIITPGIGIPLFQFSIIGADGNPTGNPELEKRGLPVFDKFYQVGQTSKGVREGTGLGLAITQHLVMEHGGKMSVVSQVGLGSRFSFTIPLSRAKV